MTGRAHSAELVQVFSDPSLRAVLERLCRLANRTVGAPVTVITLIQQGRPVTVHRVDLPARESAALTPLVDSLSQRVLTSGNALVVDDAAGPAWSDDSPAVSAVGTLAYLGTPLMGPGDETLGCLCLVHTRAHAWSSEELAMVQELAAVAVAAIELRAAGDDRGRQQQRREGLLFVARRLAAEPQPERVLRELVEAAVNLLDMHDAGVARWDAAQQTLIQVESFLPSTSAGTQLDLAGSASGRAAVEQRLIVVGEYQRVVGPTTPAGRAGAQLVAALPLQHEGRLLGTLSVSSFAVGATLSDDDKAILELLASLAAAVLVGQERARLAGGILAAFTAQHELANALTAVSANVQLIHRSHDLSSSARERAEAALQHIRVAAGRLQKLGELIHLVERDWGRAGRTIDLDQST
jgi:GAF domain-containing protein